MSAALADIFGPHTNHPDEGEQHTRNLYYENKSLFYFNMHAPVWTLQFFIQILKTFGLAAILDRTPNNNFKSGYTTTRDIRSRHTACSGWCCPEKCNFGIKNKMPHHFSTKCEVKWNAANRLQQNCLKFTAYNRSECLELMPRKGNMHKNSPFSLWQVLISWHLKKYCKSN